VTGAKPLASRRFIHKRQCTGVTKIPLGLYRFCSSKLAMFFDKRSFRRFSTHSAIFPGEELNAEFLPHNTKEMCVARKGV
jgi:hypothetical protein